MNLARALDQGRTIRVIGFDDSPFDRDRPGSKVIVNGVVCRGTRFEGMVSTHIRKDGWNSTDKVLNALQGSKFLPQLHLLMFDGIAFGGFNVLDLERLWTELQLPVVSVMRNEPDLPSIDRAIQHLPNPKRRAALIARAGTVHAAQNCHFQVVGEEPDVIRRALEAVTDTGHLPEAIRVAHLIGSALVLGQSGRRA